MNADKGGMLIGVDRRPFQERGWQAKAPASHGWPPSERERRSQLHDAVALPGGHRPEKGRVQSPGGSRETESQGASVVKGPQRRIQEVLPVHSPLPLFPL